MELRLLSIGSASTLGSIPVAEIRRGLNKLVRDSGSKKPRAALIHDNGQDFIQFYSTETAYRGDFEREAPCHIQWCRHSGSGSEREYCFSDEVNFDQAVECFQLYAQGKEDWDQGISWEPYKEKKWSLMNPPGVVAGLAVGLSSFFLIPHFLEYGFSFESLIFIPPYALAVWSLWFVLSPGADNYGKAWDFDSAGEGSCHTGCRGGGCGGSGGDGGGGGCGGCGGGGE